MTPPSSSRARGDERLQTGHPWIYRADVADVRAEGGDIVAVRGAAGTHARRRRCTAAGRRSRCACSATATSRPTRRCIGATDRGGDRVSRRRWPSTRRRTAWCTAKPISCRRSSSIDTATIWSCRRCRRAWIGCCRRSSETLQRTAAAARHPGAQRSAEPAARGARAARRRARRRRAGAGASPRDRHRVRRRSAARPEDRPVPRSAREPRCGRRSTRTAGCSTASATTAASRSSSARRCEETIAIDVSEDAVARLRQNARAQRRRRRRARRQRVRRAARARAPRRAVRHDRARPAGVREEQGVGAEGAWPATRRSTCAR